MRRGVNIRDSRARWMVWVGGSSKISVPGGMFIPDCSMPRVTPFREMKVSRFSRTWVMSS